MFYLTVTQTKQEEDQHDYRGKYVVCRLQKTSMIIRGKLNMLIIIDWKTSRRARV